MTWIEFKVHIEHQMKEKNISQHTPINYIDITLPECGNTGRRSDEMNCPSVAMWDNQIGIS